MRKTLKDFKDKKISNLDKIKGGGTTGPIEKDLVRRPTRGKRN